MMSPAFPASLTRAESIAEAREAVRAARQGGATIGFVPTMGALHEGHRRLIETAASECAFTVVSIFVNPTQFGPNEDFARYPRTLDADLTLCEAAGAKLAFVPSVEEMYPGGASASFVEIPDLTRGLCAAFRPGHFRGVATVVLKLFNCISPDIAYFGEKDFQQLAVIKRMVSDFNLPVEVRGVPTVREADGLALSSRNRYLGTTDRRAAVVLWHALSAACCAVREGERSASQVRHVLTSTVESQSRVRLQYADVVDSVTLRPLARLEPGRAARALVAAYLGDTRLIDNVELPPVPGSD